MDCHLSGFEIHGLKNPYFDILRMAILNIRRTYQDVGWMYLGKILLSIIVSIIVQAIYCIDDCASTFISLLSRWKKDLLSYEQVIPCWFNIFLIRFKFSKNFCLLYLNTNSRTSVVDRLQIRMVVPFQFYYGLFTVISIYVNSKYDQRYLLFWFKCFPKSSYELALQSSLIFIDYLKLVL
jgi:hypothetical protein